jgi:hypothetical protein
MIEVLEKNLGGRCMFAIEISSLESAYIRIVEGFARQQEHA